MKKFTLPFLRKVASFLRKRRGPGQEINTLWMRYRAQRIIRAYCQHLKMLAGKQNGYTTQGFPGLSLLPMVVDCLKGITYPVNGTGHCIVFNHKEKYLFTVYDDGTIVDRLPCKIPEMEFYENHRIVSDKMLNYLAGVLIQAMEVNNKCEYVYYHLPANTTDLSDIERSLRDKGVLL